MPSSTSAVRSHRMYPTDAEVLQLLREHKHDQGRRFYLGNFGENMTLLLGACRRFSAMSGHAPEVKTCWRDLAYEVWQDVDENNLASRIRTLRRWGHEFEAIGVLTFTPWTRGSGKTGGTAFRWTFTPKLDSAPASARSSAGSSVGCPGVRRRRETDSQRYAGRIRPYDRRGGQKVAKRFVRTRAKTSPDDASAFFSEPRFVSPRGPGSPYGEPGPITTSCDAGFALVFDASAPPGAANVSAATETRNGSDEGRGSHRKRDRAAELAAVVAAFEATFDRPARLHVPRWFDRWEKATRRADRYGLDGRGPNPDDPLGFGAQLVLYMIEDHAALVALGKQKAPASIAYFIPILEARAKEWRHDYRHRRGLCRHPEQCRSSVVANIVDERRRRLREHQAAAGEPEWRQRAVVRAALKEAGFNVERAETRAWFEAQAAAGNGTP